MVKWQKEKVDDKFLQIDNIIRKFQENINIINNKVLLLETKIQNLENNNKRSESFFDKLFCY
tara:strand:- start:695 stop:880 length:186 start_codon:yes stop_codon:yes gene_type:complete